MDIKDISIRQPTIEKGQVVRCDHCANYVKLSPAPYSSIPLRIDPLAYQNNNNIKWCCDFCLNMLGYDHVKRKIVDGQIVEYVESTYS